MKTAILTLLAVAVLFAISGAGSATLAPIIAAIGSLFAALIPILTWAKAQLLNPFAQGVLLGAVSVLVLQTVTRGRIGGRR